MSCTLTHQRDEFGRCRHIFGDHQHEHGESQQDGDAESDLFAGVGRQPEPEQTQHRQPEAREDDVEQIVKRTPSNDNRERHVGVRFPTARVVHLVAFHRYRQQLPLAAEHVVGQVDFGGTILNVDLRSDTSIRHATAAAAAASDDAQMKRDAARAFGANGRRLTRFTTERSRV